MHYFSLLNIEKKQEDEAINYPLVEIGEYGTSIDKTGIVKPIDLQDFRTDRLNFVQAQRESAELVYK